MPMVKKIFISFIIFISAGAYSQSITIKGNIIDETKQAAIGTSLLLLNPTDSSLFKGTVTDIDGNFRLENIPANSVYILKILSLGYNTIFKYIRTKTDSITLATIALTQSATHLKEVVVE